MCADDTIQDKSVDAVQHPEVIACRPIDIFLRPDYVSRSLSSLERLECYIFNFHFLSRHFSQKSLLEVVGPGIILFKQESESGIYICSLSISKDHHFQNEGELCLTLSFDNSNLYDIAFSIVPGYIVSLRAASAILISRMQGYKNSSDSIRAAIKYFRDVSPQAVLFSVLQGLANALKIKYIVGVSAREQVYYTIEDRKKFAKTYDEFYLSVGARGPIRGFFYLGPNGLRQFLSRIPENHRSRTKAKRKLKLEISIASEESALKCLLGAEGPSSKPKTRATLTSKLGPVKIGRAISALQSLFWGGDIPWMPKVLATLASKLDPAKTELVISPTHLFSQAGTRVGDKIVATGEEGCLVYGPYLTLRAGQYSVRFAVETNAPTSFRIDIVADGGGRILADRHFSPKRPITAADVKIETITDYYDVEFRVFVFPGASIQFSRIEIKRLDRHSIFLEGL